MYRRLLLSLFLIFATTLLVSAQMSEDRIIKFIAEQQQEGKSQEQIVFELSRRGVTVQQLQAIRAKYDKQKSTGVIGETLLEENRVNRARTQNGSLGYMDLNNPNEQTAPLTQEERLQELYNESMFLFADSIYLLKQSLMPLTREIYGHNIFKNKNLTFSPSLNISTPTNYKLGPGDEVIIDIWGASQMTVQQTISPDGNIVVENLGPIYLNGLTVEEANGQIKRQFSQIYAGLSDENATSHINLSLGQVRSIQVNVMGEVENPGTYTLSAFATVFNALYMAGGVSDIGSMRDVKLYRNSVEIASVDIYEYMQSGVIKDDIRLTDNDVIIVPPYRSMVSIDGRIRRPMLYEMRPTESLQQLIDYAGGLLSDAFKRDLRIIRMGEFQREIYTVRSEEFNSFLLADGDSVYVDSILTTFDNMVEARGSFFRPGEFQLNEYTNSVGKLVEIAGGLKEEAFLTRAILSRTNSDKTLSNLAVDIDGIVKGDVADIELKRGDLLFVPSIFDIKEEPTLQIYGEVMFPGRYKYADNMQIEDLIILAGGMKMAASISKIDVIRKTLDNKSLIANDTLSTTYTFSVNEDLAIQDNSFLLMPYDEVYIRRSPGIVDVKKVMLDGEVLFPGYYSLTTNSERISDVISRAGMFTSEAYPLGARLERIMTDEERLRMKDLTKIIAANDSAALASLDMTTTFYVGIDLEAAINNPGGDEDIFLRDGDRIIVPAFTNTVKMNGEVMYSNTITYSEGKRLNYYVDKAGGYTQHAKKRKAYIVYMNGSVARARRFSTKLVQPGCEIVVPTKGEREGMTTPEIISLSSTSASLATVVLALINLFK